MGTPDDIPAEIREQLPNRVWKSHKTRTILKQLKEMRSGHRERRGAPERYDGREFIRIYIEIESRARLETKGRVLTLLQHPKLRLEGAGGRRRLNRQDIHKLRKLHSEGKHEAEVWGNTAFMGRPHPMWIEIQRSLEARMAELQTSAASELFFLKDV